MPCIATIYFPISSITRRWGLPSTTISRQHEGLPCNAREQPYAPPMSRVVCQLIGFPSQSVWLFSARGARKERPTIKPDSGSANFTIPLVSPYQDGCHNLYNVCKLRWPRGTNVIQVSQDSVKRLFIPYLPGFGVRGSRCLNIIPKVDSRTMPFQTSCFSGRCDYQNFLEIRSHS